MEYLLVIIREYRNSLVAAITLVISVLLLLAVRPGNRGPGFIEDAVIDAVGGVQELIQSPIIAYRDFGTKVFQWQNSFAENTALRQELKTLRPLGARVVELEMENHRLRQLLRMSLDPEMRGLGAKVVGDTSSAFASVLLIDAGRKQGSRLNAPVLVPDGVVGRVVQTGTHTSLVLTLLDLNSRIPALVQRTRVKGIAAGTNGKSLNMEYIAKDADIRVGDRILTSGLADSFPKGFLLGHVSEVKDGDTGLFQRIVIKPSVDFDRVEEVLLLTAERPPEVENPQKQFKVNKKP